MGVAAWNRGSVLVSRQIRDEFGSEAIRHNLEVIERINGLPKGTATPFQGGIIAYDKRRNGWWILDSEEPDAFGYLYPTIKAIMADWRITITGIKASPFGETTYTFRPGA